MAHNIKRFKFAGADFEISVINGELVVDIATSEIDYALVHPDGAGDIPRVFIRLNEGAIRTTPAGAWQAAR